MTTDDRAAQVRAAVMAAARETLARPDALELAAARATAKVESIYADGARPAERRRRENAELLRQLVALGNRRDAAMILARRTVRDPSDAAAIEVQAQHIRRLRRRAKKNEQCAFPAPEPE